MLSIFASIDQVVKVSWFDIKLKKWIEVDYFNLVKVYDMDGFDLLDGLLKILSIITLKCEVENGTWEFSITL